MANEIELVFEELLFGSGRWFGLIFLVGTILILCHMIKKAGIVFFPILIFLALEYLNNVAEDSSFMWSFLICLIACIMVIYELVTAYKKR